MEIFAQILVSFIVTNLFKWKTALAGSNWLRAINLAVALLSSILIVWQDGNAGQLEGQITVILNTIVAYTGAWLTHRLVKGGYVK
jgi:hypothetical protein